MSDLLIENVQVLSPGTGTPGSTPGSISGGTSGGGVESLFVKDGKITEIGVDPELAAENEQRFDGGGCLLTPGLIDVHVHGTTDYRFDLPEQIEPASSQLGRFGTTTAITTILPQPGPELVPWLEKIAAAAKRADDACLSMLHLEGPFVALPGAACATEPGDLVLLEEMIAACQGQIKVMSIAPEMPGIIAVIERLVEAEIAPFITHTRASVEQTRAANDAGARHATHFYDVFPLPEETDPGVRPCGAVETILADPRCTVDFVCDGTHVDPIAIKCALAAKGYQGVILITDANVGAGAPAGIYPTPWGYPVKVTPGAGTRIHDPKHPLHGALAGSSLTMDGGINNLMRWLDLPPEQVWAMGTSNPARVLNLPDKGVIRVGADADLVLWDRIDDSYVVQRTWYGGRCVYAAES